MARALLPFLSGDAKQFVANLSDARFARVEALARPSNKLTLDFCQQVQRRLPHVAAIDAMKPSRPDALIQGFGALQHLRLHGWFDATHLRSLLARHGQLRVLEVLAPWSLLGELEAGTFGGAIAMHQLEMLSFDFGSSADYKQSKGFSFSTACDELTRHVLTQLPNLKRLCLNRWLGISEANVGEIFRACPNMLELRLAGVPVGEAHASVTRTKAWCFLPPAVYIGSRRTSRELRNLCARFTQNGADVSAIAAVADFRCPFCRNVKPLSEREVCMQSMMIAIGPLFRANGPQAAVGGPDQPG